MTSDRHAGILVVVEDRASWSSIDSLLERTGYRVVTAADVAQALAAKQYEGETDVAEWGSTRTSRAD